MNSWSDAYTRAQFRCATTLDFDAIWQIYLESFTVKWYQLPILQNAMRKWHLMSVLRKNKPYIGTIYVVEENSRGVFGTVLLRQRNPDIIVVTNHCISKSRPPDTDQLLWARFVSFSLGDRAAKLNQYTLMWSTLRRGMLRVFSAEQKRWGYTVTVIESRQNMQGLYFFKTLVKREIGTDTFFEDSSDN